jgi:hypothetical protein
VSSQAEAAQVFSHYSSLAVHLPSSYLGSAVEGFQGLLERYSGLLASLEQVGSPFAGPLLLARLLRMLPGAAAAPAGGPGPPPWRSSRRPRRLGPQHSRPSTPLAARPPAPSPPPPRRCPLTTTCAPLQVMPTDLYRHAGLAELDAGNLQQQLPTVISHLHDYLIRVAAQLERQHAAVGRAKESLLRSRPGLAGALQQVGRAAWRAGVLGVCAW